MRKGQIVALILGIVVFCSYICGVFWMIQTYINNKDVVISRTYSGRVFLTESQWDEFKATLANQPDTSIIKMTELSSSNPLVDFTVKTNGEEFPYGKQIEVKYADDIDSFLIGLFMTTILFFVLIIWSMSVVFEWSLE